MPVAVSEMRTPESSFSPRKRKAVSVSREAPDAPEDEDVKPKPDFKHGGGGGKRSFLKKAKRFGKQGKLGRGYKVDDETYGYFVRIFELSRNDEFDDEEEKEVFVENSLSIADESEVNLCSNQFISRVIENLLPFASEERIAKFCDAFTPNLRVIVSDAYASHVLERLLELTSSDKWRSSETLTAWFEKASMFVLNNFEEFTFDTYGSFVMKKVLECLSGRLEEPPQAKAVCVFKKTPVEFYGDRKHNEKWEKMLQDFSKRFSAWPQFFDLGKRPETARLVQNVIENVHRTKNSEEVVKELILKVLSTVPKEVEADDVAHRTLEVCLAVSNEKLYDMIYEKYYKGHLSEYIHGHCYTLLKIISSIPNEKYFVSILDELKPSFHRLFQEGHISVINGLITQSVKLEAKQKELYNMLKSSGGGENLAMTLITLGVQNNTDEDGQDEGRPKRAPQFSNYFGSNAVQALMDFKDPQEILKSICKLDTAQLKKIALDPKASFIISKFFKSWNVPNKMKLTLLDKLKECLVEFATTKFGSRIIDVIWLWAGIQQKTIVAELLSERVSLLAANKFGKFLVENLGLQAMKRNKKEWVEHMQSQDKRKKEAADVASELGLQTPKSPKLETDEGETPKKGKKKRKSEKKEADESLIVSQEDESVLESPKKKKKNKRKSMMEEADPESVEAEPSPRQSEGKKKKNRKSQGAAMESEDVAQVAEAETPKKKKKRKSSVSEEAEPEMSEDSVTPKNKKKSRKSEGNVQNQSILDSTVDEMETPSKKKKKDKKRKE